MKTFLFSFLVVSAIAFADPPHVTTEDIARNKFSLLNKPVALAGWAFRPKEVSPTQTKIEFGNWVVATIPTAAMDRFRGPTGRMLYVYVFQVDRLEIQIAILGNHVGYDLNRKPVFSWQQNGDKW